MRRDAYPTPVPRAYPVGSLDERLGAERWRRRIGGKRLPTVVYAWDDLTALVGAANPEVP